MSEESWIFIEIEDECQGSPEEMGLDHFPDGFTAQDVIDEMKREAGGNDRTRIIRDWSLSDNPAIKVTVSHPNGKGGRTQTFADWGWSSP